MGVQRQLQLYKSLERGGKGEREKKGYKAKIRVSFQHTGLQEANYLQIITPGSFNISVVFSVY